MPEHHRTDAVRETDTDQPPLHEFVPFRDVPKLLPRSASGKTKNLSRVYDWHLKGIRGVKLKALKIGGTLCTHPSWLFEFFERITHPDLPRAHRTPLRRQRSHNKAEAELIAAGL